MKVFLPFSARSYIVKIFFSYVIIVSTTIFILSLIMYSNFRDSAFNVVSSSVVDKLSQASYSFNYLQESAKASLLQIYSDNEITNWLNRPSKDFIDINKIRLILRRELNSTNYIHSISIYSRSNETLVSTSDIPAENEISFLNFYINGMITDGKHFNSISPLPRMIFDIYYNYSQKDSQNVYSYIIYEYSEADKELDNALIVNIKVDFLVKMIQSMSSKYLGDTLIIDSKGIVVCSSNPEIFLNDFSKNDYIKNVLASEQPSGYFISNVKSIKSIITFVSSENIGWKYISVIPYKQVIGDIDSLRNKTIAISLVILIFGIFLSLIVSKKIYSPINNIKNAITKISSIKNPEHLKMKDLQLIDEGLKDFSTKIDSLELLNKEKLIKVKNDFLRDLILTSKQSAHDEKLTLYTSSEFERLNINLSILTHTMIIIIKIDNISQVKQSNMEKIDILNFSIGTIAKNIIGIYFQCETVDMGKEFVTVIVNLPDDDKYELNNLIKQIQSYVHEQLKVTVTASLGPVCSDIFGINTSFLDAIEISDYRLKYGYQSILSIENIEDIDSTKYVYPNKKDKHLQEALKLGNKSDALSMYNEILSSVKPYSINDLNIVILKLAVSVNNTAIELEQFADIDVLINLSSLIRSLNSLETIEQINQVFFSLFEKITDTIKNKHDNKSTELINKVLSIINNNYTSYSLTLGEVASEVGMSSVYLGKIFKQKTNTSISEYINELRLNKAKELLKASSSNIKEISIALGYSNETHFHKIFKKTYGITPSEFRKQKSS